MELPYLTDLLAILRGAGVIAYSHTDAEGEVTTIQFGPEPFSLQETVDGPETAEPGGWKRS